MPTPLFRPRDKKSTQAARDMIRRAAQRVIDEHENAIRPLRTIVSGRGYSAKDSMDALADYRVAREEIEDAEAIYYACLLLWGATKYGVSIAAGCRVATVTRRIAGSREAAAIAGARGADLKRLDDGSWRIDTRRSSTAAPATPRRPLPKAEL